MSQKDDEQAGAPTPSNEATRAQRAKGELEPGPRRSGFAALHYPNYRYYFIGQLPSVIGMWMQTLALSWVVLTTLHGSALDLGIANALNFGPVLIFGLYAGVIADRFNKRDLVNITQAVNLTLAAAQAVLLLIGRASLTQVFAFALVLGIANAFNQPARQAMTSELVDRRHLLNAISLNSAVFNVGRVVGPSIAGVLIWQVGPAVCFAINAACYVFGLIMFRRIHLVFTPQRQEDSSVQRLAEGLRFVRRTESVLLPTILIGFVATFAMNFNIWVPLLATESFGLGSSGLGLLTAGLGVGSLLGALNLAFSGKGPTRRRLYASALLLGGFEIVLAIVSASALPLLIVLPALAATGFFMSTTSASANTIVQSSAPDELRGRVMSVYMTVFTGTIPIGSLLTGVLAERLGAPMAIGLGGAVAGIAAVVILIWREGLARKPADVPATAAVASTVGVGAPVALLPTQPRRLTAGRPAPAPRTLRDAPAYAPPEANED